MIEGASRTSLIRLAGLACRHALYLSRETEHQAAIVNTGPLAKIKISHTDIANKLHPLLGYFDTISVDDIFDNRIPKVFIGGMVVTGYSDKFLRKDIEIRKIPRSDLRNIERGSMENKIQICIRTISIDQPLDFNAGRLWFLILSDTLPHGEAFKKGCWWSEGPFIENSAVSEIRIFEKVAGNIDLVTFENDLHKWAETGNYSFSSRMLD